MNHKIFPSHIAVLVPSVRKAADFLSQFKFQIGKEEDWEDEGTREIYVEKGKANSLLLMEPAKPGAYRRALEKRGPGLHHLAIDVLNIENFIESLVGSGWLLHPLSVKMLKQTQTAYLAPPGFPGLIEVQQQDEIKERSLFVNKVSIPFDAKLQGLIEPIGLSGIVLRSEELSFSMAGQNITVQSLL